MADQERVHALNRDDSVPPEMEPTTGHGLGLTKW